MDIICWFNCWLYSLKTVILYDKRFPLLIKLVFQHDPDTKMCSPGSQNGGNYIMYDKVSNKYSLTFFVPEELIYNHHSDYLNLKLRDKKSIYF